ncbi:MAG: hypothetical protein DCC71_25320, partial [Proteobacteria bacterium]
MLEFAIALVTETARILYEGSLYILLGFGIAGLLQEFLPGAAIARHLGGDSLRSVTRGALLGIAMPLCSCGVVPAAAGLRRKGASKSATTSFLISTPETGEESIALTWGLLGPVMAIVRPLVALVTAVVAGVLVMWLGDDKDAPPDVAAAAGDVAHDHAHAAAGDEAPAALRPLRERVRTAGRHGFVTLMDELVFWLLLGIALTGLLAALLPNDFFTRVLGWDRGLVPMLAMLVVGVPLYLCASASTPVAAGLVAKGLSPGAALVFLLTGPATNVATIALVRQMLGGRVLRVYLASIAGVAIAAGLLLDFVAADRIRDAVVQAAATPDGGLFALVKIAAAFAFLALAASSFARTRFREGRRDLREQGRSLRAAAGALRWRHLTRPPVLGALALAALAFLAARSTLVVGPGERGVVQRFGRVERSGLEPGLHLHWPSPIERGFPVDVEAVRQLAVGFQGGAAGARAPVGDESFFLTADENLVDLRSVVHWRVSDPARFALGVEDAESLLRGVARRVLVGIASGQTIDAMYADGRVAVETAYRRELARQVEALAMGFAVLDARLLDVHAPASVHDAFRDVASSLEDRETQVHDAAGYAVERRAEGEGEAAALTERARADAHRMARVAAGTAAGFAGIAAAH